jgi:hypothetical protein
MNHPIINIQNKEFLKSLFDMFNIEIVQFFIQ